jgi:signal peptidase I
MKVSFEVDEENRVEQSKVDEIKSLIRLSGYLILFLYFFTGYVASIYRIEGSSMNPLLFHGDRIVSDRLTYKFSDIQRGDVIVFLSPSEPRKYFIKRVIGLPGETIRIIDGTIYVNNQEVDNSFIPEEYRTTESLKSEKIPMGHYFVAGDHRNVSDDSRVWSAKPGSWPFVPERYIQGKVRWCVWPLSRVGGIHSISPESMLTQSRLRS